MPRYHYKPETLARRTHARLVRFGAQRAAFERNIAEARERFPQFTFPDVLPESNTLWLETGTPGPRGFAQALTVCATRIKFEEAF